MARSGKKFSLTTFLRAAFGLAPNSCGSLSSATAKMQSRNYFRDIVLTRLILSLSVVATMIETSFWDMEVFLPVILASLMSF